MTGDELRAITAAGPTVITVTRTDMLALLDEKAALQHHMSAARYETIRFATFGTGAGYVLGLTTPFLLRWLGMS